MDIDFKNFFILFLRLDFFVCVDFDVELLDKISVVFKIWNKVYFRCKSRNILIEIYNFGFLIVFMGYECI